MEAFWLKIEKDAVKAVEVTNPDDVEMNGELLYESPDNSFAVWRTRDGQIWIQILSYTPRTALSDFWPEVS